MLRNSTNSKKMCKAVAKSCISSTGSENLKSYLRVGADRGLLDLVPKLEAQLILHCARARGHLPLHVLPHALEQVLDIADLGVMRSM
jgi:hypothetical protein